MKKNYLYAFLTVFIWATMASIAKLLLSDIPNLETLSVSSIFAFLFLLLINIKNGSIALKGVENTAKIANLAYLTPFLSLVVSTIVLKEQVQMRAIIALIFIVGGILLQSVYDYIKKTECF